MNLKLKLRWNSELLITILFFGPQINYYIACLLSINGLSTITSLVYGVLYLIGMVSYLKSLRNKYSAIAFFAMTLSLIFSAIVNPAVRQFMVTSPITSSAILVLVFLYFPVFLLLINGIVFEQLMIYMRRASTITLIIAIVTFYIFLFVNNTTPTDYMSFAYMMLTPIFISLMYGWRDNIFNVSLGIIASFIVFIIGCRGAVVTIAFYLILRIVGLYSRNKVKKSIIAIRAILVVFIGFIALNAETLLRSIDIGLQGLGFTSRTIAKLLRGNGAFIESEGRWTIWHQAINNIDVFGKGLFGDRTVIIDEYGGAAYAHNFFLEILVDFGILLGAVIVIAFLIITIRSIAKASRLNNLYLLKMSYVMCSILFAKHMISTSFLTSFDFWFYFGFAIYINLYSNNLQNFTRYDEKEKEFRGVSR